MKQRKRDASSRGAPPFIGSPGFLRRFTAMAKEIRRSSSTILISGETGTGKSRLANYFYQHAEVYKAALKTIMLSEIPESLFEAQLFGYQPGAFLGATRGFEGQLRAAHGGTVIFKDVSTIPLHLQAKLSRLIDENAFDRIGEAESVDVDVRVIATSNEPLWQLALENKFRQDLYYQLAAIHVELPPLRNRVDDIPPLAQYYLQQAARQQRKRLKNIDEQAQQTMQNYAWPGNVRQLKSEIAHAVSLAPPEKVTLMPEDLSAKVRYNVSEHKLPTGELSQDLKLIERRKIIDAIRRHHGNKTRAARELGMQLRTLYNKLKAHEIGTARTLN